METDTTALVSVIVLWIALIFKVGIFIFLSLNPLKGPWVIIDAEEYKKYHRVKSLEQRKYKLKPRVR